MAVAGAAVAAAAAALTAPLMARFPPYDRRQSAGALRLLRRDGVDVASWANFVAGTWWSMIGSFVPVVLVGAGLGPALIGWLVTLSEAAGAGTLLLLRRTPLARIRPIVRVGAFAEMAVLAAIALAPPLLPAYGALLIVGGIAAGAVTSLGPALVTMVANDQEQGDALALSGTFRSLALLGAPAAVGALLAFVALPIALAGVAAVAAAPGLVVGRARRVRPVGNGGAGGPPGDQRPGPAVDRSSDNDLHPDHR